MEMEHDSTNGSPVKPPPKKSIRDIVREKMAAAPQPENTRDEFMRDEYATFDNGSGCPNNNLGE